MAKQINDNYGFKRLKSKSAHNAIIQKLANNFNLTSSRQQFIAEAY